MKKITFTFLFITLLHSSYAQVTYFNYLDYSSEWRNYAAGWTGLNGFDSYSTTYFDGDETINGRVYYKQYQTAVTTNYNHPFQGTYTETFLYGPSYVREDSNGIFWYLDSQNNEQLSCDNQVLANAQIGDPFPSASSGNACQVNAVEMHTLGTTQLKHLKGSIGTLNSGVVEGIGEIGLACSTGFEYNSYLNCYTKQGNSLQFGTYDCSVFPVPQRVNLSTHLPNSENSAVVVAPNPTNGILTVKMETLKTPTEFRIYNSLGALIKQSNLEGTTTKIDLSSFASGIYFLKFNIESQEVSKKIVKL